MSPPKAEIPHGTKTAEQKSLTSDADVDRKEQARSAEKPMVQLVRYLEEPRKDGPFTNLQGEQAKGAGDTAFIGSWAGK